MQPYTNLSLDVAISAPIFDGLPRVTAWCAALANRPSVKNAVLDTYPKLFREHLRQQGAMIAA